MTQYFSPRGKPLVYCGDACADIALFQTQLGYAVRGILTVENYCKWYSLFLVVSQPSVVAMPVRIDIVDYGELSKASDTMKERQSPYVDHAPNPHVIRRLADDNWWVIDDQSYEMMIGRWELDGKNRSEYDHE